MESEKLVKPKNPNKTLTVHLVPHTHDDVGWIKTVDAYFNGFSENGITANVNLLLDNILD